MNSSTSSGGGSNVTYETIENYSWENLDKTVKLYIDLPGVGGLPKEDIQATVQKNGFGGQELLFFVHKLNNKVF